jgi:DNA-directed RNA polymerase specialized sigma24 family protein
MSSAGSVTGWLHLLQAGNQEAAQPLWEAYCRRLAALARRKLSSTPRQAADEEDVALSAFDSFCRAAEQGRFPQLRDRNDLWRLLVVLTVRKALRLQKQQFCQKRGGGRVSLEVDLPRTGDQDGEALIQALSPEPSPEFVAQAAEEARRLMDRLTDPGLRSIAQWKLEGWSVAEIAGRLDCLPRTVYRRLRLIRSLWEQEDPP